MELEGHINELKLLHRPWSSFVGLHIRFLNFKIELVERGTSGNLALALSVHTKAALFCHMQQQSLSTAKPDRPTNPAARAHIYLCLPCTRLEELGGSNKLFGLARIIMCLAEVPFFYASGALIERMGVRGVVAMAQIAYIVRFLYYSVSLA